MLIVPEHLIADLITPEASFDAVQSVFAAMAREEAYNFPVVREALGAGRQYGFKSGLDRAGGQLGVKAGGYFPGNAARGMINHQSTVFLFEPNSGVLQAMVGGNLLTALRTAAASAVSIAHLARADAQVLGMIGAGHQSLFQMRAAVRQRQFTKVVGWNHNPEKLSRLADCAAELGLSFRAVSLEELGAVADVIITITSSHAALLRADQVRPGTHLACMGTDTIGKQEVEAALLAKSRVFTDEIAQSISIGEAQHAIAAGLITMNDIVPLGAVINGTVSGRRTDADITLFDGTGVGLQDIAVAARAVELAVAAGVAIEVEL